MKNFFNKIQKIISIGIIILVFCSSFVNTAYASDLTLDNFTGSGTWDDYILKGTSTEADGDYTGVWHSGHYKGTYGLSVTNGVVSGTFDRASYEKEEKDRLPAIDIAGAWSGITPVNPNVILSGKEKGAESSSTYTLLAPFGDKLTSFNAKQECALTQYVNIVFDIIIGICAVLAFLMLVIGGIQYMASSVSEKEDGRSQMMNAVLGLVVAMSSWLILNTINPKLLDFCLDKNLAKAEFTVEDDISDEATTLDGKTKSQTIAYKQWSANNACPGQPEKQSETCVKLDTTNLPKKYDQYLEKDTLNKMLDFDKRMKNSQISWYITEAFPPSSKHASICHNNGTCLDLNFVDKNNATPQQVKIMLDNLVNLGMCPHWEIYPGGITQDQLTQAGVSKKYLWISRGTAQHIHVVNGLCSKQ